MRVRIASDATGIHVTDENGELINNVKKVAVRGDIAKGKMSATITVENIDIDMTTDVDTKVIKKTK